MTCCLNVKCSFHANYTDSAREKRRSLELTSARGWLGRWVAAEGRLQEARAARNSVAMMLQHRQKKGFSAESNITIAKRLAAAELMVTRAEKSIERHRNSFASVMRSLLEDS